MNGPDPRPHLDATMTHALARSGLVALALLAAAASARAQVKEPPRAETVKVEIRYRIRADRDERVRQYLALQKFLAKLGFEDARKNDPDRDLDILDPNADRFVGTMPGAKVLDVLNDVRVQNVLFAPADFARPEGDKPIAVKLGLSAGHLLNVQQKLHEQTVAHLAQLGFVEALGYDTRGYTLIRGAILAKNVDLLVRDIRAEPSGWFVPNTRVEELRVPLRDRNPLRWAEVLPVAEFAAPFAPAEAPPGQLKVTPDLRTALAGPAAKDAPLRVEVVFRTRVDNFDALKTLIQGTYPGSTLDGYIGNVVTVRLQRGAYVDHLAREAGVLSVRLPRQGAETIAFGAGAKGTTAADALKASRLDELHRLGYTGAGVKVVLIGTDFTGADKLVGTDLPRRTTIVDLTTELSPDLLPFKPDPARAGTGTAAARALAAAAPGAELVLVRIDPGSFFHLNTVVRLTRGLEYTDALLVRLDELTTRAAVFDALRVRTVAAYKEAFRDLSDSADARRKQAKADLDALFVQEKEVLTLAARFNDYQRTLGALAGARVIVNTLVWESGYPLDSLNEFAGTLDRLASDLPPRVVRRAGDPLSAPPPPLVWVQAASAANAAVWGGPFRDANGDSLIEFAPPTAKPPAGDWSRALNFLGTRAAAGEVTPELAADTKLRLVVQWREPADPNFPDSETPAYPLTLRLLRQIDPNGETRSSDEMAEVARSAEVPSVIYRTRTFLVFEQMLEFTVPAAGRYALMVQSLPAEEPLIPAQKRDLEIYPRIAIETVGTAAGTPKAVFRSFTAPMAGVGTPGDALGAITVGADASGALTGGGTGLTLRGKPDVLGPAALTFGGRPASGPGIATAFAGGAAAALLQTRAAAPNVFRSTGIKDGAALEVPAAWLKIVPPAPRRRP